MEGWSLGLRPKQHSRMSPMNQPAEMPLTICLFEYG